MSENTKSFELEFNSLQGLTKHTIQKVEGKYISQFEITDAEIDPQDMHRVNLKATFTYSGQYLQQNITFAQAISHGYIPSQGMRIAPIQVIPDNLIQSGVDVETQSSVVLECFTEGDYNFKVSLEVTYVDIK